MEQDRPDCKNLFSTYQEFICNHTMKNYSVILTEPVHQRLMKHLVRRDGQEDLCFATYIPSTGSERTTAIISELIMPGDGDRDIHGNVGFMPQYFERALATAASR